MIGPRPGDRPGPCPRAPAFGGALAAALAVSLALVVAVSHAEEPSAPARGLPRFGDGTAALLHRRCVRCHGARDAGGGLRLDSFAGLVRGGERGPAIIERDPDASLLYRKIRRIDRPPMPPRVPLPAEERAIIRAWIAAGALP